MALIQVNLSSRHSLQKMHTAAAIVPEGMPGPFPVLYVLHGLSDDHTAWVRRTNIERYVENLPLMVVFPNVGRAWYTDSASDPLARYEMFVAHDLVGFIDNTFNTIASREGRAITGQSMGGYGAFKLALKHPDTFCAAASLSGALDITSRFLNAPDPNPELELIFGKAPQGGPEDLFAIIDRSDMSKTPALWMDCGSEDFLIEGNRAFHAHLQSRGVDHHYQENPGAHTWGYWDARIQEALSFLTNNLGIAEGA